MKRKVVLNKFLARHLVSLGYRIVELGENRYDRNLITFIFQYEGDIEQDIRKFQTSKGENKHEPTNSTNLLKQ